MRLPLDGTENLMTQSCRHPPRCAPPWSCVPFAPCTRRLRPSAAAFAGVPPRELRILTFSRCREGSSPTRAGVWTTDRSIRPPCHVNSRRMVSTGGSGLSHTAAADGHRTSHSAADRTSVLAPIRLAWRSSPGWNSSWTRIPPSPVTPNVGPSADPVSPSDATSVSRFGSTELPLTFEE